MVHLLLDIRQAPNPNTLGSFLGRISMVSNVIIVSPHGYFGQANILGLPDTGGQVLFYKFYWILHDINYKWNYHQARESTGLELFQLNLRTRVQVLGMQLCWILGEKALLPIVVLSGSNRIASSRRYSCWLIISNTVTHDGQLVYILDQVRALENEMLIKIQKQGLDVSPKILIVCDSKSAILGMTRNILSHFIESLVVLLGY